MTHSYVAKTAICIYYDKNAKLLFELPALYQQLNLTEGKEENRKQHTVKKK